MRCSEVLDLMKERYCAPEWALLFEVGNATGFKCNRHADAVAMSLWPSRGLELHGFEVKVSTSDWRRERQNPEKAEAVMGYMDRWWLVAAEGVKVEDGELPSTWGLLKVQLVKSKPRLVQVVEAPKLIPAPCDRGFLAALLRRLHEQTIAPSTKAVKKAHDEGHELGYQAGLTDAGRKHGDLAGVVARFEAESGLKLDRYSDWRVAGLAKAVKRVVNGEGLDEKRIECLRDVAKRVVEDCDAALAPDAVEEKA